MISSEVTFQTNVGSEKEDPVFQRGAVFIYAYQAVTSESESKVRLFSPFPQPPAFQPAGALRLRQIVKIFPIPVRKTKIISILPQANIILHPCIASSTPMIC